MSVIQKIFNVRAKVFRHVQSFQTVKQSINSLKPKFITRS